MCSFLDLPVPFNSYVYRIVFEVKYLYELSKRLRRLFEKQTVAIAGFICHVY